MAIAAAISFVVTLFVPSFSFGPTFAATIVAWLLIGLSTLADE